MRKILTHTQRTMQEIADQVHQNGSFTAPLGLPHYRYDGTRTNCHALEAAKIIKRIKKHDIHVYFVGGDNLQKWISEGRGKQQIMEFCRKIEKEQKAANPTKPKSKTCRGCGVKFETINHKQKSCQKGCIKWNTEQTN